MSRGPIVAIDGPAGSGKSTVARELADVLSVPHVDTGALYRAVALACLRAGIDPDDGEACGDVARSIEVRRFDGRTWLDGEDVEDDIRTERVSDLVSRVSGHPDVRDAMTPLQRTAAAAGGVVEGRDIGTVVLPHADLKVFLTASVDERARRRAEQLGVDVDEVRATMAERDERDSGREVAPLVQADDAWELVTDGMSVDEVVDRIAARVDEAVAEAPLARRLESLLETLDQDDGWEARDDLTVLAIDDSWVRSDAGVNQAESGDQRVGGTGAPGLRSAAP